MNIRFLSYSNFLKLSVCLGLFLSNTSSAQQIFSGNKYPLTEFRQPLDIVPPTLSGSFGEIRSNHFHSGLDFRTNQREGYPVYAIADGYVSRLRVQNSGFGLAVYINHPSGYTSVYGHLQRFSAKIAPIVKELEYAKKSFEIDEFPQETLIPVRKGEVIGWSGNRGSSGGPHLHFEIRETKTEHTVNPQFFGLNISDKVVPTISSLYVYQLDGKPFSENTPKKAIPIVGVNGNYRAANPVTLNGEVGFGISANDRHDGASGNNGVYSIELYLDGHPIFISALEKFSFENTKAINSHIDYSSYLLYKKAIQKSFLEPGNPLKIYHNVINQGKLLINDRAKHELKYIVTDAKGNHSTLSFTVIGTSKPQETVVQKTPNTPDYWLSYNQTNEIVQDDFKISFPKGTLYSDLNLKFSKLPKPIGNAYSPAYQIHNRFVPLHTGFDLYIKADMLPETLINKAVVVNSNRSSQGGIYQDGYLKANPKNFGTFHIAVDTIAPKITPINIVGGKNMSALSRVTFKISDNLSGIKSFNGYIDDKWVLFEFDAKTATLWHTFEDNLQKGTHKLELIVVDMKENIQNYSINFIK